LNAYLLIAPGDSKAQRALLGRVGKSPILRTTGSCFQGEYAIYADINRLRSRAECPMGPPAFLTASCPTRESDMSINEIRPAEGRRLQSPHMLYCQLKILSFESHRLLQTRSRTHLAGLRILPPISVPTPIAAPRKAKRAASPPLLPPVVNVLLYGLTVRPHR
jgi:hypothetical protein